MSIFFAIVIGYLAVTAIITSLLTFVGEKKTPKEFSKNFEICVMWLPFIVVMGYLYGRAKILGKSII